MSKAKIGEDLWKNRVEKVVFLQFVVLTNSLNAELFVLTYGSVVAQLCKDTDDANEVNKQLEKMSVYSLT
jgi:trafficking protein particle complex subunit 3